jgi:arylsulfatase
MISANPQLTMWDGWDNGFDEVYGPSSITPGEEDLIDWEKFTANHDGIQRIPKAVVECIRSSEGTFKELIRGIRILRNNDFPTVEEIQERIADISFNANSEFLFVNMMDVHTPYAPPKEYRSQKTAISPNMEDALTGTMPEKEVMRQAYESSVQYVSDIYKDIHDLLTDSFDYVFTISDHGELLGEYNLCNHNYGVYPELTHVPLQISGRDIENQTSETPVSILDIHQTIAELANVDVESRGQNLLGEIHPQPRLTEYHGLTK